MEKFVENGSVKQLLMRDASNTKDCFLFKLAKEPGLEWFKQIYLFSSVQDKYIQFDSARIQIFEDTDVGTLQSEYEEMVAAIFENVTAPVTRVDVNFVIEESNIDTFIGRKAHMQFIQNGKWLRMFTHRYKDDLFTN